jgi:hypothetical protein
MLMLNMTFINFKFIYNFVKLTIKIMLTIPLIMLSRSSKDEIQNLINCEWNT